MRKNTLVIQISVVSISLLLLFVSFASDALEQYLGDVGELVNLLTGKLHYFRNC